MDKASAIADLYKEMQADAGLPLTTNLVLGEGNLNCDVMFIGEAPGAEEDKQVRPFVGRAGQLLNKCLAHIGWSRETVYITNIVKRRPPENRDPLPEEIAAYKPYLTRQIELISPKIIVPLGRFSMNYFLPEAKITRDHGKVFRLHGRLIIPFFHPAAVLRGSANLAEYYHCFELLKTVLAKYPELIRRGSDASTTSEN